MHIARIFLVVSMAAASSGALAAKKPAIPDPAWFQQNSQALCDALAPGNKAVWDKAYASDAVISDEDGKVETKAEVLKVMGPLPPGSSGDLKVIDLKVLPIGTVGAVVDYVIDEHEDVQGQQLHTRYTVTDVYRSQLTGWKIVASHVTVVPRDMDPVPVDKTGWPALVGEYRVGPQSKHSYHVYLREGALLGGADEQTATALIPLSPLVYFQAGSIHTMIFVPDGKGGIAELREVHKYNEVVLKRVGP